jgi:hypothetical protein
MTGQFSSNNPITVHPVFPAPPSTAQQPRHPSKRVGIAVVVVVALMVGVGIGATAASNTHALNSANRELAASRRQAQTLRTQVGTLQTKYSDANTQAQNATTLADGKAKAAYAARNAALAQLAKSLDKRAQAISAEEGMIQASQISGSGVYAVGRDIKAGTYHTSGDGGQTDDACYFATLNSTNTSDISDNNNFDGAETVDLNGVYAFQISGPCTWIRTG